ncbi:MAG: hypothetical protein LBC39_05155 [Methanobrevibacter sp.]|jgi:hypothetical protein|nr:hypothetical protein [Candidatus Methanovirga aequatorialis]
MSIAIKTMIMKELNSSLSNKKYILSLLLNLFVIVILAFGLTNRIDELDSLTISMLEVLFMGLPLFNILMLNMSLLNEIFVNEKLVKTFEAILTTPLSLFEIVISKLISVAILNYVAVATSVISLYLIWGLRLNSFIPFPTEIWIMIFIVVPLFGILYGVLASYLILKFNYTRLIEILNVPVIFAFVFLFRSPSKLLEVFSSGKIVSYPTIISLFILLMIFYGVLLLLIKKISVESVTVSSS